MKNKLNLENKNIYEYSFKYLKICLWILFIVTNTLLNKYKGLVFISNKAQSSLILKEENFSYYQNTSKIKISIFIPIYNKEGYIYKSIKSIITQTLIDIEIIAINDYSSDNSLKILLEFAKNDKRIKIINNDKNKGLLYSRAMGILSSSGEYLLNLDSDDELKGYNTLKNLYYKAKRYNLDIINFVFKDKKQNKNINNCKKINTVLQQPELFNSIFNKHNEITDYNIWNKLVRREIFIKAYNTFKEEIYNWKWNYYEDDIWNILINKYAKSKICVNRMIYIYNYDQKSLMNNKRGLIEFQNLIYRHEMYKKIFSTKENEKYLIAEYLFLFNRIKLQIKALIILNSPKINMQIINIFKIFLNNYKCSTDIRNNITKFINTININSNESNFFYNNK